jgi:hypothetical protein
MLKRSWLCVILAWAPIQPDRLLSETEDLFMTKQPGPKIEFLYWEDCPSHPQALELLQGVMAEVEIDSPIEKIEVLTDEDAERLAFPGSPTIRVDGVDVDAVGAAQMGTALTCRIYLLEDGRFSPVPSKEMLRRALVKGVK